MSLQISNSDKAKFLDYLSQKQKQQTNHPKVEEDVDYYSDYNKLYELMVQDLMHRAGRTESEQVFKDYIFTYGFDNLEALLSEEDKQELDKRMDSIASEEEYLEILLKLMSEYKYTEAFMTGIVFGYAKLAYKLKLEPKAEYMSVVEIFELIKNLNSKTN